MLRKRSIWGACKRALYGAPEIWDEVREYTKELASGTDQENLLLTVMSYAAYGVKVEVPLSSYVQRKAEHFCSEIENQMSEDFAQPTNR